MSSHTYLVDRKFVGGPLDGVVYTLGHSYRTYLHIEYIDDKYKKSINHLYHFRGGTEDFVYMGVQ